MVEQVLSADVVLEVTKRNDSTVSHLIEKNGEIPSEIKISEKKERIENRILKTIALYFNFAAMVRIGLYCRFIL